MEATARVRGLARLGKPGDQLREKIAIEHLKQFADTSLLAQQIILDRPKFWEFKLTAEIFRSELGLIHSKWQQLKRDLYVRKSTLVDMAIFSDWLGAKINDGSRIVG